MSRMVECVVLKRQAEGLEGVPHPGELGQRIYANVSQEGWQQWLQRLAMIINENGLSTADPASIQIIESHMRGFFFGEGGMGGTPDGYQAPGSQK
ncbi:MAG TPA: oxidative damage protection protein [Gammaproteobacteria bacterium]|nr:oxidative damage protection protein [Gammaproteobacteria bacterium]